MVNKLLITADIILVILDARRVEETKNEEIETNVNKKEKQVIYVINKVE